MFKSSPLILILSGGNTTCTDVPVGYFVYWAVPWFFLMPVLCPLYVVKVVERFLPAPLLRNSQSAITAPSAHRHRVDGASAPHRTHTPTHCHFTSLHSLATAQNTARHDTTHTGCTASTAPATKENTLLGFRTDSWLIASVQFQSRGLKARQRSMAIASRCESMIQWSKIAVCRCRRHVIYKVCGEARLGINNIISSYLECPLVVTVVIYV